MPAATARLTSGHSAISCAMPLTFRFLPLLLRWIWREKWAGWVLLTLGIGAYSRRPAQRLLGQYVGLAAAGARAGPHSIIRFVGDAAKMLGYPVGVWWRLRNSAFNSSIRQDCLNSSHAPARVNRQWWFCSSARPLL